MRTARATLFALTTIHLLNYLDRYVLSAVLPWVREDFGLDDARSGLLGSLFMVAFLVASPLSGYLGDRVSRRHLIAGGVALWSLATMASGLAPSFGWLAAARSCIGIGEAGYAVVAPGYIADLFRPHDRGRALAWFYLAIPLGSALGYILGGVVGQQWGWRPAFFVAGAPGLVMAAVALRLDEPPRGATEEEGEPAYGVGFAAGARRIFRTPAWRWNTVGSACNVFTLGALAFWMPEFLVRIHGVTGEAAGLSFGVLTVVAGVLGTLGGGIVADRRLSSRRGAHLEVSGWAMLAAAPLVVALPFAAGLGATLGLAFVAALLLAATVGPLNAALVGCVPSGLRAAAVAANVFLTHSFGDAVSPFVVGALAEEIGLQTAISLGGWVLAVGGAVLIRGAAWVSRHPRGLLAYPE